MYGGEPLNPTAIVISYLTAGRISISSLLDVRQLRRNGGAVIVRDMIFMYRRWYQKS